MADDARESAEEPSTVDSPVRWSGSAAVPPPSPGRSRWTRNRPPPPPPSPPADELPTPVDPWAGQDTPWDPMTLPPPAPQIPMAPTRIEAPAPTPTPTTIEPPVAPPPAPRQPTRVNRLPVQPRPDVTLPPPPPKKYRRMALRHRSRPAPAPPPAPPPRQERPLPPPRKRRRRWPRRLALVTLFGIVGCCGVPLYFAWPAAQQYPVSAILPDSVADLALRDDDASRTAVERLNQDLSSAGAFAGVYADGNGKRVTIFGATGLRLTPEQDAEAQITHLAGDYAIEDVVTYDLGVTGAHERCGVGRTGRTTVAICVWADHGSMATVLTTRRSVEDTAELTGVLRNAVLVRG